MIVRHIATNHGPFVVPGEPEERSRRSEECVREVLDTQIYSYPRDGVEQVSTILDIGCNVGAFIRWAKSWWPGAELKLGIDPNGDAVGLAIANTGLPAHRFRCAAVTVDPYPLFVEEVDWGGSRTYGQSIGVPVQPIHPHSLPQADVLKVDAEGVEVEVLSNYPYLSQTKIVCLEYHETRFRKAIMSILQSYGFEMRRGNPLVCEVDTQVWVQR